MTLDEMKTRAAERVQTDNPSATHLKATKVYENIMNGTLITVAFRDAAGKDDSNHIHFASDAVRTYRWHSDVLNEVAHHKERRWFFRFLEMAGIGGFIACILVIVFSILLSILAFSEKPANPGIVDIIKLSFTIVLGFFFGTAQKGSTRA